MTTAFSENHTCDGCDRSKGRFEVETLNGDAPPPSLPGGRGIFFLPETKPLGDEVDEPRGVSFFPTLSGGEVPRKKWWSHTTHTRTQSGEIAMDKVYERA